MAVHQLPDLSAFDWSMSWQLCGTW